MGFLAFLEANAPLLNAFFSIFAGASHSQPTPEASAAELAKQSAIVTTATNLIATGNAMATGFASAPTGIQKLAVAQASVQALHNVATVAGVTTESFDAVWNPINAAITAVCAAKKQADADKAQQDALIS